MVVARMERDVDEVRYCDQGCGYRLPEEYGPYETTCGACIDNPEWIPRPSW